MPANDDLAARLQGLNLSEGKSLFLPIFRLVLIEPQFQKPSTLSQTTLANQDWQRLPMIFAPMAGTVEKRILSAFAPPLFVSLLTPLRPDQLTA